MDTLVAVIYNSTVSKISSIYEISTTIISNGVFIAQIESKENSKGSNVSTLNK